MIIGITGTLGAGKGTVVDYLVKNKKFLHFSVSGFLTEIIKERNLPVNRDSMVLVANELRAKHSPSYLAETLYDIAKKSNSDCIIESLRTVGEIEALEKKGNFYLLAVDAEPKLRYERAEKRKSEKDGISYETFIEHEKREMTSTDPTKQNLSACIKMAHFVIENNGTLEELHKKIDDILKKITEKKK